MAAVKRKMRKVNEKKIEFSASMTNSLLFLIKKSYSLRWEKFELLTEKKIKIKLILNEEKNGDLFAKTYGRVSRLINIET